MRNGPFVSSVFRRSEENDLPAVEPVAHLLLVFETEKHRRTHDEIGERSERGQTERHLPADE